MAVPLLQTKLYIPPARPELGLAPAPDRAAQCGTGPQADPRLRPGRLWQDHALSEWIHGRGTDRRSGQRQLPPTTRVGRASTTPLQVAWLSLDEGDNDLARFLVYLVAALQTLEGGFGQDILATLQSPSVVNHESILRS